MRYSGIDDFNAAQSASDRIICERIAALISAGLPQADGRIWHGHPVWFLDGNPVVGYSRQKPGIRLMFWSGADFDEPALNVIGKTFRDASIFYTDAAGICAQDVQRWLTMAETIQWDYKNIVRNKGLLRRI